MNNSNRSNDFQSIFETFRDNLDGHHDRRERVVKTSRDITALSKKIIFSLQRVRTANAPVPPSIAKENQTRLNQISDLFRAVAPDVAGLNAWRYQRQLSPGIQEFIEALSFQQYVQTQTLISLHGVISQLPPEVLVSEEDYLMGIFDLTGEMMRFAITALTAGGQIQKQQVTKATEPSKLGETEPVASVPDGKVNQDPEESSLISSSSFRPQLQLVQANLVVDLREMRAYFESLNVPRRYSSYMMRDMCKKVEVMQNSVEKVEHAAYGILVRGSERPAGWMPDLPTPTTMSTAEVEIY